MLEFELSEAGTQFQEATGREIADIFSEADTELPQMFKLLKDEFVVEEDKVRLKKQPTKQLTLPNINDVSTYAMTEEDKGKKYTNEEDRKTKQRTNCQSGAEVIEIE